MNLREFIRNGLNREPENSAEWVERGDYLFEKNRLEDAVVHYGRALALDPDNLQALRGKAGAIRRMGDLEAAKAIYQRMLSIVPDDNLTRLALGYVHSLDGDTEKAVQCFDRVLEKDPKNITATVLRFFVRSERLSEDERVILIREIEAANPGFFTRAAREAVMELVKTEILGFPQGDRILITGDSTYVNRDIRELEEAWPKIIAASRMILEDFSPDKAVDLTDLNATKDLSSSQAPFCMDTDELEKLRKRQPVDARGWFEKGDRLCRSADHGLNLEDEIRRELYRDAGLCFDRVCTFRPPQELMTLGWLGKGYAAMRLARYPEALSCFDEAVRLSPDDPAGLKGRAHALSNMGRAEDAGRCFEQAREMQDATDPHHILWMTARGRGYIVSRLLS